MSIVNLGQIAGVKVGLTPPTNVVMLWYDTNTSLLKFYNSNTLTWDSVGIPTIPNLANVLTAGDETGANDISILLNRKLQGYGGSNGAVEFISDGLALSSDGGAFGQSYLQILATYAALLSGVTGVKANINDILELLHKNTHSVEVKNADGGAGASGVLKIVRNGNGKGAIDASLLTDNRSYQIPNASGVFALLSDIIAATTLSAVLANNNETGANDIVIKDGQSIRDLYNKLHINFYGESFDDPNVSNFDITNDGGGYNKAFLSLYSFGSSLKFGGNGFDVVDDAANAPLGLPISNGKGVGMSLSSPINYFAIWAEASNLSSFIGDSDLESITASLKVFYNGGGTVSNILGRADVGMVLNANNTTFNSGIDYSVILAGINIVAKTNNTAYVNQIGYNTNSIYELIVKQRTLTDDRLQEHQDKDGLIALETHTNITSVAGITYSLAFNTLTPIYHVTGASNVFTLPDATSNNQREFTIKNYSGGNITIDVETNSTSVDSQATNFTIADKESLTLYTINDAYFIK